MPLGFVAGVLSGFYFSNIFDSHAPAENNECSPVGEIHSRAIPMHIDTSLFRMTKIAV